MPIHAKPNPHHAFLRFVCASGTVCLLCATGAAQAQSGAAAPAAAPAASVPTVLGRPVNERALREAARPYRWIINADQPRRDNPASAGNAANTGTSTNPAAAAATANTATLPTKPARATAAAVPAAPRPAAEPAPSPAPAPVTARLPATASPQTEPNAPPAAAAPTPTQALPTQPAVLVAAPAAAEPAPAPIRPVLQQMVEPDLPESLLNRLRRSQLVQVDMTIGMDGKVQQATVVDSSHPGLAEPVRQAVLAWVYAPLPRVTRHSVQIQVEPN